MGSDIDRDRQRLAFSKSLFSELSEIIRRHDIDARRIFIFHQHPLDTGIEPQIRIFDQCNTGGHHRATITH